MVKDLQMRSVEEEEEDEEQEGKEGHHFVMTEECASDNCCLHFQFRFLDSSEFLICSRRTRLKMIEI